MDKPLTINPDRTVSFTGHRPDKLGGCYNIKHPNSLYIKDKLIPILIDQIENHNIDTFITGGAIGLDQIAFWTVNHLKKNHPTIKNILAIPFCKQPAAWKDKSTLEWYGKMLEASDYTVYVDELEAKYKLKGIESGVYHVAKMQKRNEYMVDNSMTVIAVWDGTKGGTYNCVKYAQSQNRLLYILNPKEDYCLKI